MSLTKTNKRTILLSSLMLVLTASWLWAESNTDIRVNRSYGRVVSSEHNEKSDLHIIHIQDAHCNVEAQMNIVNLIDDMVKNYGVKIVGVEGASGKFDTGRIATFPDKEVLQQVTEYFLNSGKISGSEYFSINYDQPDILLGIEDNDLYLQNYEKFMKSLEVRNAAIEYFQTIDGDLKLIQEKCASSEIWEFNQQVSQTHEVEKDFTAYCTLLHDCSVKNNVSLEAYPNFVKLIETLNLENKIDFDLINTEKAALLDALSEVLVKDELARLLQNNLYFRINRITPGEYYSYLTEVGEAQGIDFSQYPNFSAYTAYLSTYDSIDQKALFIECDDLQADVRQAMCVTDDDNEICALIESAQLWEKYTTLQLSTADLEKFKQQSGMTIEEFDRKMDSYCKRLSLPCSENTALIQTISDGMNMLDSFYQLAKQRDEALANQLLAEMDLEGINTAILIAGGFHTQGIVKQLEDLGVSYDVVIPEITKEQEHNPYYSLMANIRTPFEEVLASNTLQLALRTAKMNLLNQSDQAVFAKELDSLLTAITADSRMAQSLTEVEMIEQLNQVLKDYDTPVDIKVLGRVTSFGKKGYRGYLIQIDQQRFAFQVQDKLQFENSSPVESMMQVHVQEKVVNIFNESVFQDLVEQRLQSPEVSSDVYDVALSAPYRKQLTYKAIDNLLETLYNLGEITPSDIENEMTAIGVDIRPEIHAFMGYFVERGLVKTVASKTAGAQTYTWGDDNAQINRLSLEEYVNGYPSEIAGKLLLANELKLLGQLLNQGNKSTTGKIKYYYFDSELPTDILYRVLAELYAGSPEIFNTAKPTHVEFESTNGKTYEIAVVYRQEEQGFFFRVGLKEDPSAPVTKLVEVGTELAESPIVSIARKGVKVATSNPFDFETVGVPKFSLKKNAQTQKIDLMVTVFKVSKVTRSVVGTVDNMTFRYEIPQDASKVPAIFERAAAALVLKAENNNVGLLHPILDGSLRKILPPDEVDRSLIEVGITYAELDLGTVSMAPSLFGDQARFDAVQPVQLLETDSAGAYADLFAIVSTFVDQAEMDAIRQRDNRTQLLSLFNRHADEQLEQMLQLLKDRYALQNYPVEVNIKLAPGALADSSFNETEGYRLYINASCV